MISSFLILSMLYSLQRWNEARSKRWIHHHKAFLAVLISWTCSTQLRNAKASLEFNMRRIAWADFLFFSALVLVLDFHDNKALVDITFQDIVRIRYGPSCCAIDPMIECSALVLFPFFVVSEHLESFAEDSQSPFPQAHVHEKELSMFLFKSTLKTDNELTKELYLSCFPSVISLRKDTRLPTSQSN